MLHSIYAQIKAITGTATPNSVMVSVDVFCRAVQASEAPLSFTEIYTLAQLLLRRGAEGELVEVALLQKIEKNQFLSMRLH